MIMLSVKLQSSVFVSIVSIDVTFPDRVFSRLTSRPTHSLASNSLCAPSDTLVNDKDSEEIGTHVMTDFEQETSN
jgi:hypothetical protein